MMRAKAKGEAHHGDLGQGRARAPVARTRKGAPMAVLTDTLSPRRGAPDLWMTLLRPSATALLIGGAFSAGVWLSRDARSGEASAEPPAGSALFAKLDERSAKLDGVRDTLQLGFHRELVGAPRDAHDARRISRSSPSPGAPSRTSGLAPVSSPPLASRAAPTRHQTPSAASAPSSVGDDAMAAVPAADSPADASAERALADQAAPPERVEEEEDTVRAEDTDEVLEPIANPRERSTRDAERVAAALARVLGAAEPPLPQAVRGTAHSPAAPAAGAFHVQVASTPQEEGAQALARDLRAQGFDAQVVPADLHGQGRTYRVRVGPFAEREAASEHLEALRRDTGREAFVVRE